MAAHRYWRVKYDSSGNPARACCVASEVEFRETIGGADVTTGGTAIASSVYGGGYEASKAFDNNNSTIWHDTCSNSATAWIGYDFGSGNTKDIVEFLFRSRGDGFGDEDSIQTGGLEWSDNGSSWTRLFSIPTQTYKFSNGEKRTFAKPPSPSIADDGGHRYWRARKTTAGDPGQAFEGISGVEFWRQGQWISNFGYGTAAPDLQSGNPVTVWMFTNSGNSGAVQWAGTTSAQWVAYDFGPDNTPLIDEIRILPKSDGANRTWREIAIDYSDDGSSWTEYAVVTPPVLPWVLGTKQAMAFSGTPPSTARRRAIIVT